MTRRVVKPQPVLTKARGRQIIGDEFHEWPAGIVRRSSVLIGDMLSKCPYGVPGDRLWVRETYAIVSMDGNRAFVARSERMPAGKTLSETDGGLEMFTLDPEQVESARKLVDCERFRPSIHMPRWASRITLEITDIRVQRLQEISVDDAIAEGLQKEVGQLETWWLNGLDTCGHFLSPVECYRWLWDSINAKRAPWASNPWVWAISYRKIDR